MNVSKSNNVKHFKSKQDYLNGRAAKKAKSLAEGAGKSLKSPESSKNIDKLSDTKPDSNSVKGLKEKVETKGKSASKNIKSTISKAGSEVKDAGSFLMKEAASAGISTLKNTLGAVSAIGDGDISMNTEANEVSQTKINSSNEGKKLNQPAIFFIKGMELGGISSDNDGLEEMSEGLEHAKVYEWKQEDQIINDLKKYSRNQPFIIVGHSFGGDVGVNIANKLNSAKHGFRKVDLLVTLDSVGFNNDLIPENVSKNLNYISMSAGLFNDGPNIAKSNDKTTVVNELREEGHQALDNSTDIQSKIMNEIFDTTFKSAEKSSRSIDLAKVLPALKLDSLSKTNLNETNS